MYVMCFFYKLFSPRLEGEETLKCRCISLRVEIINIVSNNHGRTQKSDFSVLDWKFSFWAYLVQKNQIFHFKLKLQN